MSIQVPVVLLLAKQMWISLFAQLSRAKSEIHIWLDNSRAISDKSAQLVYSLKVHTYMINWRKTISTATDEDDLADIIRELTDVAVKWRNIGIQLGIRDSQLEAIQGDNPVDYLRQMLSTWLRKNYSVERFGEPTWVRLVEAVNDSAGGGNHSLAMKIAKDHEGINLCWVFIKD